MAANGYYVSKTEGYNSANWILMDFGDLIVHIFDDESRSFYDLERIWKGGKVINIWYNYSRYENAGGAMIHIFIVNSNAGNKEFANGLRVELSHIEDIEYYVFDVRYAGYEVELLHKVQHIFEDEKLRIYCCGGSGTLRNVINGIEDYMKKYNVDDINELIGCVK